MNLQKALFILPNAFTAASIFCGLYSILESTSVNAGSSQFANAAMAIFYAAFFDMFDGRVARMTKTQSDFGVQMDSLADAISFGVAPSILVYKWGFADIALWGENLGFSEAPFLGRIVMFCFALCGVIRLARFNVLAARGEGSSDYFIGLPIPMAASMLVALVIFQSKSLATPVQAIGSVMTLVLILSYLMISNVRYYTFKTYRPSIRNFPILILGSGLLLFIKINYGFSIGIFLPLMIVLLMGSYIFIGLILEVLYYRRRKSDKWKSTEAASMFVKSDEH